MRDFSWLRFILCFFGLLLAVGFGGPFFMWMLGVVPPNTWVNWNFNLWKIEFWYFVAGSLFLSWIIGRLKRRHEPFTILRIEQPTVKEEKR
ncbi:MAG: hypothetical protein HYW77_02365 [Parcubacteria group bacterium]|nr:hypothetical protein [Parcubacteria group bacterium]